ncbi:MAG: DUF4358 domain-containing protein [Clostridia bacterium]|nr:DUF4358 domain-containing protein [Clostridia bacterium]
MKKKIIAVTAALIAVVAFAGCSNNSVKQASVQPSETSVIKAKSVSAIFDEIKTQTKLPEMLFLEKADDLDRYYGITPDDVEEFAGGIDNSGTSQDEIVIIKAKDDTAADNVQKMLQKKYDSKLNQIQNYDADETEKIKNGKVEKNGLYVTLVISNDFDKITEIIKNSI